MAISPFDRIRDLKDARDAAHTTGKPRFRQAPEGSVPVGVTVRRPSSSRQPGPIARLINRWWTRLLEAIFSGSFSEQEARYEDGSTGRDYLWNTLGTALWGCSFPVLTIVATQLAGAEGAGMFSMAFVVGTLLMIAANFGVRNYQVSDIDEANSFSSYQAHRWVTGIAALVAGTLYCTLRSYNASMTTICLGVFTYKVVDGIADVYEGRLQQADKLYLAGISQTVRSACAIVAFAALLFVTRSLEVASIAMAVAAVASLVLLSIPLALLETDKSRPMAIDEVTRLFRQGAPLFAALFLFNLIESMPKFAMEGTLAYENQLYFNALYFPAQGILLTVGFIYKPQLVRLASIWANPRRRRRFDLVIAAVMCVVVALCIATAAIMGTVGIPFMSFAYGLDFERFRALSYLMVAAGGITAAIDFLYAIITVLRRQGDVMRLYLVAFVASAILPFVLVRILGLTGAVVSYLVVMAVLLALLIWQYAQIRQEITRARDPFAS